MSTQAALWRKDFLYEVLRENESAWDFEGFGSIRFNRNHYPKGKKIFIHKEDKEPVFDYQFLRGYGYGIVQGKWQKKNVDLFNKYGIEVDFTKRGFIEDEEEPQYTFKDRAVKKYRRIIRKIRMMWC